MTYAINPSAKNAWIRDNADTMDLSVQTDADTVYLNNGRTVEQELGEGYMVSNVNTVDSAMSKVIDGTLGGAYDSCVFEGKTKWIDNVTQEILDTFDSTRNSSLIDVKMTILRNVNILDEEHIDYKTNSLSTSEDVILRGIENVKDTYNALTGEYIQHIGEREYQIGDEINTTVVTDMTKTQYILLTPIATVVDPIGIPFAYVDGHVILESGYIGQSLLPTLKYSTVVNRTGQIIGIGKTLLKQETQLTNLEKVLIQSVIGLDYNNTLMTLILEIDEVI